MTIFISFVVSVLEHVSSGELFSCDILGQVQGLFSCTFGFTLV